MPCLVVAGPHEFLPDDPFLYGHHAQGEKKNSMPPAADAKIALAAYNLTHTDAGWMSPKSAQWFMQNAGSLPAGFSQVNDTPVSRVFGSPAGKIGIVFFPEGPVPGKGPTPEQAQACLAAGKKLQKGCALVIGVSPWGYVGERDFLPLAQGVFNCLFGGGEGVGFGFTVPEKTPDVLWLRPDSKGRAVNVLELYTLPRQGEAWKENTHFGAWLEFLDNSFTADPDVLRIVGNAPK